MCKSCALSWETNQLCGPRIAGLLMGISRGLCAFRALGKCQPVRLLPCKCCSRGRRNPALPNECSSMAAFQLTLPARLKKGQPLCAGTVDCPEMQPSKLESMEGAGLTSPGSPLEFRVGRDQVVQRGRKSFLSSREEHS